MPTYAQLQAEPEWRAEVEAPAHAALNARLRKAWNVSAMYVGSKGDNNHLRGRHRSRNWITFSSFCTDRSYAATDGRDKRGDGDWLRATDFTIPASLLYAACRRLDEAVRAGRLPCVAEWFGTFDGKTVVGWYQGRPSSSDSSHLWHGHVGLWTQFCDDAAQLELLGDILTGEDMTTLDDTFDRGDGGRTSYANGIRDTVWALRRIEPKLDGILTALGAIGTSNPDVAAILAGVDGRLAELRAEVEADTRDAVADLAEGGAGAVRADAE